MIKESETRTTSGPGEAVSVVSGLKGTKMIAKMISPPVPENRVEPRVQSQSPPSPYMYQSKSFIRLTQALAVEDEPAVGNGENVDRSMSF